MVSEKQRTAWVKKFNKILGMIKCNFVDRSKETVMALNNTKLVKPHLKYWILCMAKDIKLIEGVQQQATKPVQDTEKLKYLGMTQLDKKTSIRWQDSAPPISGYWPTRLVTQRRHGCRAMRRSVCNAGDSNGGRSLCVQVSREQSYPLPIYWYHSKGNWLLYNFAADSFYMMKLCSRLCVLYCRNCPKDYKFRYFMPIFTKLGAA